MQRDHDQRNPTGRPGFFDELTSLAIINSVIVLALIVLALSSPSASERISAAVQAEFVGDGPPVPPTQVAEPAAAMRTVRSN